MVFKFKNIRDKFCLHVLRLVLAFLLLGFIVQKSAIIATLREQEIEMVLEH